MRFLTIVVAFLCIQLRAQDYQDVKIKTFPITEGIYMLEGAGGNIGVCIGDEVTFIIDDQFEELSEKINMAISELTSKPVEFVINTHYHGDHVGGNSYFGEAGAIIYSHENVRKRILSYLEKSKSENPSEPMQTSSLPKVVFSDKITIHQNGHTIEVFYQGAGHTDGDIVVRFVEANVFHMGDLFVRYGWPYIDMGAGGDVAGMIRSLDYVISLADEKTVFIPGHGKLANINDVVEFRNMLSDVYTKVKSEKENKVSLEDINIDNMTQEYEKVKGNASGFVSAVYNSIP